MTDAVWIVLSTFGSEDDALRVARALVEERLVACAQIESRPITSVYRWQGEVHEDAEVLLRVKTTERSRAATVERLDALHPYDVPQVVWFQAFAIAPYAKWARQQCDPGTDASNRSS